jgi:16S rRNA pseudouridine516 synthase
MINILDDITAVIFDLDGSLVDSMWMWKEIDIEYLGRYNIPLPDDLQQCIEGMSFTETACYFKQRFSLSQSVEEIKQDWNNMAWDKYTQEVFLKEGVQEFLDYCRKNNIRLGIATSNSRELVEAVLKARNITDYFSCIMTGCDVNKGKPAPDIYLAAAQSLGVLPQQCLVFEDVIMGIRAARAAGMRVCAVEDIYSAHQQQEKQALADYYIEDFRALAAACRNQDA